MSQFLPPLKSVDLLATNIMGRIVKKISITGTKSMEYVDCLFDSGATMNFISPKLVNKLGVVETIRSDWIISLGGGRKLENVREVELVEMELLGRKIYKPRFLVMQTEFPVVIGAVPMQHYGIRLIMKEEKPEIEFIHPHAGLMSLSPFTREYTKKKKGILGLGILDVEIDNVNFE